MDSKISAYQLIDFSHIDLLLGFFEGVDLWFWMTPIPFYMFFLSSFRIIKFRLCCGIQRDECNGTQPEIPQSQKTSLTTTSSFSSFFTTYDWPGFNCNNRRLTILNWMIYTISMVHVYQTIHKGFERQIIRWIISLKSENLINIRKSNFMVFHW